MGNFDSEKIKHAVRELIVALGDDPEREGLVETPSRVARMYEEVFEGMAYTNDELVKKFNKCFHETSKGEVSVNDIECFSYCEHHMALMYDLRISVKYIPHGKVIGLSKIARIADMVCKRLQLQERIGEDILYILSKILGTEDIQIDITGKHSCMTARGIRKSGSVTRTRHATGCYSDV